MNRRGTSLAGRVAIVTGAGQGVGEGIARRLAEHGATVIVAAREPAPVFSATVNRRLAEHGATVSGAARRAETGEPVAASIRGDGGSATCVETDVTKGESISACVTHTVAEFGRLDIVVHNAFTGAIPHRLENAVL
ncbi:MAG: SDR family NAD(P)-dependent oxidoreductase, partial [Ilumatobacteraceae bacterium]